MQNGPVTMIALKAVKRSLCAVGTLLVCSTLATGTVFAAGDATSSPAVPTAKIVLNWLPEGEFGALYQAHATGIDVKNGVSLQIMPGGAKIQAAATVGSGSAQFGVENAQNLVIAKSKGVPLVALAATIDQYPQCFIYHSDNPIEKIEDLNGHTVSVSQGSGVWLYLQARYDLQNVKSVPYTGSLASFARDHKMVQQCMATSEPYVAKKLGLDVGFLEIAKSTGFNPYGFVLFTTEAMIKSNPTLVAAVTKSFVEGLQSMLDNPEQATAAIVEAAPDSDPDAVKFAIFDIATRVSDPIGKMTAERWQELYDQMTDTGVITQAYDWQTLFTNEFYPDQP